MKKFFLTIAAAVITIFFISARAGMTRKMDKEGRKQLRKEKREQRKELWLHSANVITENQFYHDFPNAIAVSWTEGVFAEANFYDGTVPKIAYYDMDNELVGTTNDIDYSVLPEKAKQYISKKFAGYAIEKAILFDDNEANDTDMYLFSHSFEDQDTYFAMLSRDSKKIILKITMDGAVSFFHDYK